MYWSRPQPFKKVSMGIEAIGRFPANIHDHQDTLKENPAKKKFFGLVLISGHSREEAQEHKNSSAPGGKGTEVTVKDCRLNKKKFKL
jgi:hypothetical protein